MKHRVLLLAPLLLACGPSFYQAPPPLIEYPQRTPGKTWRQIFAESHPQTIQPEAAAHATSEILKLVPRLPSLDREARLKEIDELLSSSREDGFNIWNVNLLHELRELAEGEGSMELAMGYLHWRLEHALPSSKAPRPEYPWQTSDPAYLEALQDYRNLWKDALFEIQTQVEASSSPLLPNWRVQLGYCQFCRKEYAAAAQTFEKVVEDFPTHPRAEVAMLMAGRARLEIAKRGDKDEKQNLLTKARESFDHYLNVYPKGRFIADAHGWLGGVEMEWGNVDRSVSEQIMRLEAQPSAHTLASVMRECDALFEKFFDQTEAEGHYFSVDTRPMVEGIARHPELVKLFVYGSLDPVARQDLPPVYENYESDRSQIDWLRRRLVRPGSLTQTALDLLCTCLVEQTSSHALDPASQWVLAVHSLRSNQPATALAMANAALGEGKSDDLLYLRAMSLSALGRHSEAAASYSTLAHEFPNSPLIEATALDRALEKVRGGNAGAGLLDLMSLRDRPIPESGNALPDLYPSYEVDQWIDTAAVFSSLEQLVSAWKPGDGSDPHQDELRRIIRCRAFAAERFDLAYKALNPEPLDPEKTPRQRRWRHWSEATPDNFWSMDLRDWDTHARELAELGDLTKRNSQVDPDLWEKMASLWMENRGNLTMPLSAKYDFSRSETSELDQIRRKNAALLGLAPEEIAAAIDSLDEYHHALSYWVKTANSSQDESVVATALEQANEIVFKLSQCSRYEQSRALEAGAVATTAFTARLRRDLPDYPETTRAVPWHFDGALTLRPWMPGDMNSANSAFAIRAAAEGRKLRDLWDVAREEESQGPLPGLKSLPPMVPATAVSMNEMRTGLQVYRAAFEKAREHLSSREVLEVVDDLDDLSSIAADPQMTADLFKLYSTMRLVGMDPPAAEGQWAPFKPWLAYWERVRVVGTDDYGRVVRKDDTMAGWVDYLREFPNGPKTEAALFRHLRLMVRSSLSVPQVEAVHFPDTPFIGGYKQLTAPDQSTQDEAEGEGNKPESGLKISIPVLDLALSNYAAKYPSGRYWSDYLVLRALVDEQAKRYPQVLEALVPVLDDPSHPELHMDASLQFAELSLRLLDLDERVAVAKAFRETPGAIGILKKLAFGDTCVSQVIPMLPWLEKGS